MRPLRLALSANKINSISIFQSQTGKFWALIVAIVIGGGLDQWLKYSLGFLRQTGEIYWGPVGLTWYENPGIAFSLPLPVPWAIGLVVALLLFLVGLLWQSRRTGWAYSVGLILVISGGVSNLIDKIVLGFVRDFVSIGWLPVFNLADMLILVGIILVILGVGRGEQHQKI
ncbi:MAG: signal peptidase II [Patescibacteria group bacterium]